jgi:hypothetical protein
VLKRPALTLAIVALLGAAFLYGVIQLFALGYRTGEVYPPYSSLRSDPLGAKVLYEALDDLPGVSVQRNFRPLPRLAIEEPITLVYAGVARRARWAPGELEAFESRVNGGARAVFAFVPAERSTSPEKAKDAKAKKDEAESTLLSFDEVAKRWAVRFDYLPVSEEKAYARRAIAADGLEIAWHSALYFADLGPEWTTLYTCDRQPVVVERQLCAGSILLAADAFFLSNEAQRSDRQPALLGRVFSGPPRIVFDEEHLGVSEQPGIANLARKYHLHGTVAALLLLAALFVWKNAVPFLPPRDDPAADGVVTGKESAEGFENLLRRTIPPGDLLGVCVEEWRKTATVGAAERARLEEAWASEQARPAKQRNAVAAYQTIRQSLTRKN